MLARMCRTRSRSNPVSPEVKNNGSSGRIVRFDEYPVDFIPSGHMLFTLHWDKPGVIGAVGNLLGNNNVNIAAMHVGRHRQGDYALMVLSLDSPIPEPILKQIDSLEHIEQSRLVVL